MTEDSRTVPDRGRESLSVIVPCYNEQEVLPEFHRRLRAVLEPLGLTHPAGMDQAQVNHDHMHLDPAPDDRHMQQATLFETVVRHIVVADGPQWPACQQRVAMLAVLGDGIGAVSDLIALGGQVFGLRRAGPGVGAKLGV